MSYKTILAHLNDEHRAVGLVAAALAVAKSNASHLVGLSVLPPLVIIPGLEGDAGAVIDDHRDTYRAEMARMRRIFEQATANAAVPGTWVELDCDDVNPFGTAASVVVSEARGADLVVISQENRDWLLSGQLDVGESVVIDSGRPVLVIPRSGVAEPFGKHVAVAWNGRREATRALFDALPILKTASRVDVVCANPDSEVGLAGGTPGRIVETALARHGISCTVTSRTRSGNVGATLLSAVDDLGADMLVMGCYGHSHLREIMLGGATRHVLQHARVPVLMAH